jgi:hypothetical protein
VALPELEVGDGQHAVDRGIERDGDDQLNHPPM